MNRNKYSKELKEQILKEVKDTGNIALIARNHGISYQTKEGLSKSKKKHLKIN